MRSFTIANLLIFRIIYIIFKSFMKKYLGCNRNLLKPIIKSSFVRNPLPSNSKILKTSS